MFKCTEIYRFTQALFSRDEWALRASQILLAIWQARSVRMTHVAYELPGNPAGNYKFLQRFIRQVDVKASLKRLFDEEADYVLGDITEMPRPRAYKTDYVGRLSDGAVRGYWLLMLATPHRGRALPCWFSTFSSATLGAESSSRNREHVEVFSEIKQLLGLRPLVLDREFSYQGLLEAFQAEGLSFVIRLNKYGNRPRFTDADGNPLSLQLGLGKQVSYRNVWYRGQVPVNLIGIWRRGFSHPLWVMSNLDPKQALEIYLQRMKIEESFKDLKDLIGMDKIMNRRRQYAEQMIALALLAFSIACLIGEQLRDQLYGPPAQGRLSGGKQWYLYSGAFVLLRQKPKVPIPKLKMVLSQAYAVFHLIIFPDVPTCVPT